MFRFLIGVVFILVFRNNYLIIVVVKFMVWLIYLIIMYWRWGRFINVRY